MVSVTPEAQSEAVQVVSQLTAESAGSNGVEVAVIVKVGRVV